MDGSAVTPLLVLRAVLELLFLLAVLGGLLALTDFRKRLFPLGASALVVVFTFVGAWGVVQMLDRWQYDYPQAVSYIPLTRFAMYQAQDPQSVEDSYAWRATLADGTEIDANIAEEFSAVGLPPMSTRMRVLMEWMHEGPAGDHHDEAETELALYGEGLLHALEADGDDVEQLSFYRVTGTPEQPETQLLASWTDEELAP